MHINVKGNTTWCPPSIECQFLLPYSFPCQTLLMILNHFCEMCTFLPSLWSKEKIKRGLTKSYPLAPSLLPAFEIFPSTPIPWAVKILGTRGGDRPRPFLCGFYHSLQSYQLVSIQSISRCNQLLSPEKRLEEKQSAWS